MKFRALEVRAFNRFRSGFTVPLDHPGLVLVEGRNLDYGDAASSNGAGKSWVWEAFLWALYGKMSRHGNKIITSEAIHPKRGADVLVDLTIGGHTFSVNRTRPIKGKASFEIRHVDGTVPVSRDASQRTEDVSTFLGFDYQACKSAIILQGEGLGLAKAEFAVQMSVLEAVLRMEELSKAADVAKTVTQSMDLAVRTQWAEVSRIEALLGEATRIVETLEAQAPDPVQAETTRVEMRRLVSIYAETDRYQTLAHQAHEALAAAQTAEGKLAGKLENIKLNLSTLRNSIGRAVCPTCQRPLKGDEEVAELRKQEQEQHFKWAKVQQERDKAKAKVQEANSAYLKAEKPYQEAQAAGQRLQDLQVYLESLEGAEAQHAANLASARYRQETHAGALEIAREQYETVAQAKAQAEFWVKGFGRDGLQAQVFQAAVPVLNTAAERYAQALSGGQLGVAFNPSRGSRLEDLIRVTGASAPSYDGLSRGEKQRVNLIVAWSLRELSRWRLPEPINLAVYDETFDGFDDAGLGVVVELLQDEVAQGMTVFVVTHNATMKRLFPGARVMTVTREGGEAVVSWTN